MPGGAQPGTRTARRTSLGILGHARGPGCSGTSCNSTNPLDLRPSPPSAGRTGCGTTAPRLGPRLRPLALRQGGGSLRGRPPSEGQADHDMVRDGCHTDVPRPGPSLRPLALHWGGGRPLGRALSEGCADPDMGPPLRGPPPVGSDHPSRHPGRRRGWGPLAGRALSEDRADPDTGPPLHGPPPVARERPGDLCQCVVPRGGAWGGSAAGRRPESGPLAANAVLAGGTPAGSSRREAGHRLVLPVRGPRGRGPGAPHLLPVSRAPVPLHWPRARPRPLYSSPPASSPGVVAAARDPRPACAASPSRAMAAAKDPRPVCAALLPQDWTRSLRSGSPSPPARRSLFHFRKGRVGPPVGRASPPPLTAKG